MKVAPSSVSSKSSAWSRWNLVRNMARISSSAQHSEQRLNDLERAEVHTWSLKFVHPSNSLVGRHLEATFDKVEAEYYRGLARNSTMCVLVLDLLTVGYNSYRYSLADDNRFWDPLLAKFYGGIMGIFAVIAILCAYLVAISSTQIWATQAKRVCSLLGVSLAATLVAHAVLMQDIRYDFHIAFMLYLFNYLPVPTTTAVSGKKVVSMIYCFCLTTLMLLLPRYQQ
jgi:hypothetical protein